jgi:hypothetical protein
MIALAALAVVVQTLSGSPVDPLAAPAGTKAVVFVFTSTDCPISNRYAPELNRLFERFGKQGVVFRVVYPGRSESADAIRDHMKAYGYAGRAEAFRDPALALANYVGATVTPEAAVVVRGRVVYHGRIDDRYADLGVERPSPTTHDLEDALAATLAGRAVAHAVTQAFGCYIADLAR